jgi:hypothetical protein
VVEEMVRAARGQLQRSHEPRHPSPDVDDPKRLPGRDVEVRAGRLGQVGLVDAVLLDVRPREVVCRRRRRGPALGRADSDTAGPEQAAADPPGADARRGPTLQMGEELAAGAERRQAKRALRRGGAPVDAEADAERGQGQHDRECALHHLDSLYAAGRGGVTRLRGAPTLRPHGALAQLGERRLCKPEVTGSIPVRSTRERRCAAPAIRSGTTGGIPREG